MEDKKLAEDLLKKYLDAKATPKEIEQVENWYNSYEEKNKTLSQNQKAVIERRMRITLQKHMQQKPEVKNSLHPQQHFPSNCRITPAGLQHWIDLVENRTLSTAKNKSNSAHCQYKSKREKDDHLSRRFGGCAEPIQQTILPCKVCRLFQRDYFRRRRSIFQNHSR